MSQGQSNSMLAHLIGQQHRQNYVDYFTNNDPAMLDLSQAALLRFAEEHNENHADIATLIKTRHSDDVSSFEFIMC